MTYEIEIRRRALKDLSRLPKETADRILNKIAELKDDLKGDVKRLANHDPEYRLRVGEYRVLFDVAQEPVRVVVRAVRHRSKAYRG